MEGCGEEGETMTGSAEPLVDSAGEESGDGVGSCADECDWDALPAETSWEDAVCIGGRSLEATDA